MSGGDSKELFVGGSEMAALMRNKDWSTTPLGPPERWPQSLRAIVRVMLTSRFAMWMGWGPELSFFYNDAYGAMTLGAKHPWALGRPSREVWAEIWADVSPRIDQVLQTGDATWDERLLLFLQRSGFSEETYHTFSYSPVTDDDGRIVGNLCVVSEETERVIGERRMQLLRDAAAVIASAITEPQLFDGLHRVLTGSRDLPFTLVYLADDAGQLQLASSSGVPEAASIDPGVWPHPAAAGDGVAVALAGLLDPVPQGAWHLPPTHALVVPIPQQDSRAGIVVAALNPFRPFDQDYRSFITLLTGQIAGGLAKARAYEEERRRAAALAEIDRAKTAFFSNVSHEFRTPLTLMLGPTEDALRSPERALSGHALEVVHRNELRLLKLVNTLLDFSRIEAGRVRARFEPVDLCALTADLASTFRSAMERAGLLFNVDCVPFTAPVYVDREMWEKVVLNLLSNAFKFTLTGGVAVSLEAVGDRAVLRVRDTGVGIPEADQPRVFERFHRVEGAHGRSHEGSGIGLALVQELVKLHGGEMRLESQVGSGSTFIVSLPLGAAHLPADQIVAPATGQAALGSGAYVEEAMRWLPGAAPDEAGSAAPAPAADLPLVLLADDNSDMRDYARRLLGERWQVEAVSNGREALAAARRRRPDAIVSDVMMPELDGFGLLRELRADPALREVPVILLSARAGEEARLEGLAASADDYLVKPFSARDLLARVDAQVTKARVRALEREHARRLTRVFAGAPVAIAILRGPEHVYEMVNPLYAELIGGRDVTGLPIRTALPELADQDIYERLDQVRASGEPHYGNAVSLTLNRGPNGTPQECVFDFVYQPLPEEDTIVVVVRDVTALAQAKDDAEAASRLKDEFLATLSHELRTPLNAILGYVRLLRGGAIGADRVAGVLETIERNARMQAQLVSDILDVSAIITGKLRISMAPVDLPGVIRDAIETVAPSASAKGVRLQQVLDHPGVPVAGDAQRLQQVVWNLLTNAIKFTPRGGRVQVLLQRVNSHVELAVSDTGEGIDPEFVPHLFQRFRQFDGGATRAHGGLGLGLALCRHLVEAHGGRITAHSAGRGQGTTIQVELPLMIVHADFERTESPRVHPHERVTDAVPLELSDLSGLTVLLVDDDVDALSMATDVLSIAGAVVVSAGNAAEALAALDEHRLDVAVIDIGLPEIDGYQLLGGIRERGAARQGTIPAAALTAYARAADRTRSLQAGFQMHLSKPVQPNELTAAIRTLVSLPRLSGSASDA